MLTKIEISAALKTIEAIYPNFTITPEKILLWQELLKDLDSVSFGASLKRTLQTTHFTPTPADILQNANPFERYEQMGLAAWDLVTRHQKCSRSAKEAFRAWGGENVYAMLPDVRYSTNPDHALNLIDRERKRFVEIYIPIKRRHEMELRIDQTRLKIENKQKQIGGAENA